LPPTPAARVAARGRRATEDRPAPRRRANAPPRPGDGARPRKPSGRTTKI